MSNQNYLNKNMPCCQDRFKGGLFIVNSKNKWTLSPHPPVGAVGNRTGLECFISSRAHYSFRLSVGSVR